jgi:hypothetical protein
MRKAITVKELREQLENMEKGGYGNFPVWFIDWNDIASSVERGIHDVIDDEDEKAVILG